MKNRQLLNVGLIVLIDMLGFGAGLESATRVVMPALASYLPGRYGPSTPGYMTSTVMILVFALACLRLLIQLHAEVQA